MQASAGVMLGPPHGCEFHEFANYQPLPSRSKVLEYEIFGVSMLGIESMVFG